MDQQDTKPHRWGMAIDLDRCTGCEACVAACHAENNLPLSTPDSAAKGRAFHWIRIDRYYEGAFPDIKVKLMPVLCQQCDEAACEQSCPAEAMVFGDLNDPASRVSRLAQSGRATRFMEDLGTQPKVFYLKRGE